MHSPLRLAICFPPYQLVCIDNAKHNIIISITMCPEIHAMMVLVGDENDAIEIIRMECIPNINLKYITVVVQLQDGGI